jgi:putative SOS response-associated peptidase YedK
MCGRYVSPDQAAIERQWQIGRRNSNPFRRRFNVLPTTQVPIIRSAADAGELELTDARWGLIPHWWTKAKPPTSTINARSEEAAGKPFWRHPYRHARCLIPAVGWYEWNALQSVDARTGEIRSFKQPFYLHVDRAAPVAFAGLMSTWTPEGGEPRLTCAIMTRAPSPSAAEVHDRMPVILKDAAHGEWLDPEMTDAERVAAIIAGQVIDKVKHHPVSTRLNSAKDDDEALIEPLIGQQHGRS